ncbi:CoA pyrophosphatase [Limnobacter humi]|uniref:CoA pyrophosphatase n=1 Tax=Limnobacter humi TaxID=1778671 RepID=A0ABT1WH98_9BURK|nr:CoA pyrophosphatase [Limnobacter humi]MCQ8896895.1 CoA pyrophosphatase [Limnobacter humi]
MLTDRLWTEILLRERFQRMASIQWTPEPLEERFFKDREPADAAVLVPIVLRERGLHVLLTQRTAHLNDHAGQISFPGGRSEPEDGHPIETALRETEEEVGLHRQHIEVLGTMPVYQTATNFLVTPVVALVQPEFELTLDSFEVAEVFEVPLDFLMNPANHQTRSLQTPMGPRTFYAMPYPAPDNSREYFIWGATAAMIRNLYNFLSAGL